MFVNFDMLGFGQCGVSGRDCFYCDNACDCCDFLPILFLSEHINKEVI